MAPSRQALRRLITPRADTSVQSESLSGYHEGSPTLQLAGFSKSGPTLAMQDQCHQHIESASSPMSTPHQISSAERNWVGDQEIQMGAVEELATDYWLVELKPSEIIQRLLQTDNLAQHAELLGRLKQICGLDWDTKLDSDQPITVRILLKEEILVYLAMFARAQPQLLAQMLRLRIGLIIQMMAAELARSMGHTAEEALLSLFSMTPFDTKRLLYNLLSGNEIRTVKAGRHSVEKCSHY
ncbi:unnamed protein product [Protopolystoma xenopodis]|uniref:Phosphorylase b kinase regulatory subunit n=1 Tax=Protopolystoma xenopodis TaxID=117903 RepID=A0A3S5CP26_9PLAT|nr:unnamed protein product [Protopolystoma xenopodis]